MQISCLSLCYWKKERKKERKKEKKRKEKEREKKRKKKRKRKEDLELVVEMFESCQKKWLKMTEEGDVL